MLTTELRAISLFESLSEHQLVGLAPLFTRQTHAAGAVLFSQGGRADKAYVLVEGGVNLCFRPEDGGWITIATLNGPGHVVGWSAVLGHPYYTSSALCPVETSVLCVYGAQLRAALCADPSLADLLNQMMLSVAHRPSPEQQRFTHNLQHQLSRVQP